MNEAQNFFYELFFGYGGWLGIVLIVALILLVTIKVKYSGVIFIPLSVFIGFWYFDNASVNSNFIWCGIIMLLMPIFSFITLYRSFRS